MIKKIRKIHDFGIFKRFSWVNSVREFKRYNFIYGYNYSGKTTLSRIFRSIEKGEIEASYTNSNFEFELSDSTLIKSESLPNTFNLRVFNSDFIEENLKWKGESNPVMIIGQEKITLQEEFEKKNKELDLKKIAKESFKAQYEEELYNFNKQLSDDASFIKNSLRIPSYFKNHLENDFKKYKAEVNDFVLPDIKLSELSRVAQENTLKEINRIYFNIPDFNNILLKLNELRKKKAFQNLIEKLKSNREIEGWVEQGLHIHKEKDRCEFCNSTIDPLRIENLEKHFSEEFKILKKEIADFKNTITSIKSDLSINDFSLFSITYQESVEITNSVISSAIQKLKKALNQIIEFIVEKEENIHDSLTEINLASLDMDFISELDDSIKKHNDYVDLHNKDILNIENKKKDAQENIVRHYIALSAIRIDYFKKSEAFEISKNNLTTLERDFNVVQDECNLLRSKIFSADSGAALISKYLNQFYKKKDLELKANANNYIQVYRGSEIAMHLSEGEKTTISLCYFLAKMNENSSEINNLIIFLDDPISSLDNNHIYNTYGVIKEVLADAKQLFISTHNIDLFSMCQEWKNFLGRDGANYFISREYINSEWHSRIVEPPKLLSQYKSDYNYLFSKIINFSNNPISFSEEDAFILPNIMRRFLETYLQFRFPGEHYLRSFKRIIDPVDTSCIYKLLNEHSHFLNLNGVIALQRKNEILEFANAIVKGIESKDKEHYDCLLKLINTP